MSLGTADERYVVIVAGPHGTVNSTAAEFEFRCSADTCTFECRLDFADWEACESPALLADLAGGGHTFSVRAREGTAPTVSPAATRSWNIETYTATSTSGRLVDNGDGTVSDLVTGLMWEQSVVNTLTQLGYEYTQSGAVQRCGDRALAGHSDWRVPTLFELKSITLGGEGTAGPHPASSCAWEPLFLGRCDYNPNFATATLYSPEVTDDVYWVGVLSNGRFYGGLSPFFVRCVR